MITNERQSRQSPMSTQVTIGAGLRLFFCKISVVCPLNTR